MYCHYKSKLYLKLQRTGTEKLHVIIVSIHFKNNKFKNLIQRQNQCKIITKNEAAHSSFMNYSIKILELNKCARKEDN